MGGTHEPGLFDFRQTSLTTSGHCSCTAHSHRVLSSVCCIDHGKPSGWRDPTSIRMSAVCVEHKYVDD